MIAKHAVARTASGLSHWNTLVLPKLWTVVITIDVPDQQDEMQDSYQLLSDDGLYDTTLQRSEATTMDETRVALRFTEVVPQGSYSLYHLLPSGIEYPIFLAVPFPDLEDHGEETEEPSSEAWAVPTLDPEPKMVSGDPLLLYHQDDDTAPELAGDWSPLDADTASESGPTEASPADPDSSGGAIAQDNSGGSGDSGNATGDGSQTDPDSSGDAVA